MQPLRKGAHGPEVLELQKQLIAAGYSTKTDSRFGHETEIALRTYQRKLGLIPDGVAGPATRQALVAVGRPGYPPSASMLQQIIVLFGGPTISAALRARNSKPLSTERSRHPVHLKISRKGLLFIYSREAYPGLSNVLHWPGGSSGVTLGPGYDMGTRSKDEIRRDLQSVSVNKPTADKVAEAAGRTGKDAEKFVKDNPRLIELDQTGEFRLLKHIIPRYEKIVRERMTVDLLQHQFDALVCFAYNPGRRLNDVTRLINEGETAKAMQVIRSVNTSGGKLLPGLSKRRELEVALYLYGDYGALPKVE